MTVSFPEFLPEPHATSTRTAQGVRPLSRRRGPYRNGLKRVFDVAAVLLAAPVVLPLILLLILIIRRDGGPGFYAQERVGRHGRIFRIWKLRTMVHGAEERLAALLAADPAARAEWEATQKLKCDPRITRFGAMLRRSSIDELPQLWNVLVGEMSLVGPRPMMTCQRALYPGLAYFGLRPGITGLWQTAGRNETTFRARADYDNAYDERLSLAADLGILARTVRVVVGGTGY
jgi:lipopolysaccharide/colanic/teichoic acid biosynthesis glycosyltransferase